MGAGALVLRGEAEIPVLFSMERGSFRDTYQQSPNMYGEVIKNTGPDTTDLLKQGNKTLVINYNSKGVTGY